MPLLNNPSTKVMKYTRVKRGGGGGDPNETYASGPPSSTLHHGHKPPTIDGSEGGFIGLVVGLGLLFIGSSFGVWYLLKRRTEKGRRPLPFFNKFLGGRSAKDGGGGFGRLASTDRRGWSRANNANSHQADGEEEGYSDDDGKSSGHMSSGVKLTKARARSPGLANQTPKGAEREGLYSNDSNPFQSSPSVTRLQDHAGPYGDAFDSRDSLDEAVHASNSRYGGGVQLEDRSVQQHDSDGSPVSPSFERGTKFREAL
ncbi:hypothetical protein FRB94_010282 [Tulasnella sp. JGI-2019a]|nr:hypothetical protein FRB94_010282 [Tulasnella sp. JGI-2019a]KAG9012349.1 hypothetical protein FRB93_001771 [Tulasnella sp. JGI-2019a]KAG9036150.1 hypothetical protein FRB95_009724 [Tulasnella sp. JGI-2019a]